MRKRMPNAFLPGGRDSLFAGTSYNTMRKKATLSDREKGCLQLLIVFRGDIFHHVLHPAVENAAQIVDGGRVQRLILAQFIQRGAGDAVVLDEGVGGFAAAA